MIGRKRQGVLQLSLFLSRFFSPRVHSMYQICGQAHTHVGHALFSYLPVGGSFFYSDSLIRLLIAPQDMPIIEVFTPEGGILTLLASALFPLDGFSISEVCLTVRQLPRLTDASFPLGSIKYVSVYFFHGLGLIDRALKVHSHIILSLLPLGICCLNVPTYCCCRRLGLLVMRAGAQE